MVFRAWPRFPPVEAKVAAHVPTLRALCASVPFPFLSSVLFSEDSRNFQGCLCVAPSFTVLLGSSYFLVCVFRPG